MKVTVSPPHCPPPHLPALFESREGLIVLFVSKQAGTVMHGGKSSWKVGEVGNGFISAYDTATWKPFGGKITLENTLY